MRTMPLLVMMVAFAGCRPQVEVASSVPTFTDACAPAPTGTFLKWTQPQQATLEDAIKETWSVVRTARFQNQVSSVGNLYESLGGAQIAGAQVAAMYVYARLPVRYIAAQKGGQTAGTGTQGDEAVINLNVDNLDRWPVDAENAPDEVKKANALKRSCLINTVAHEWTHTIPGADGAPRFQDGTHTWSRKPLVSYTLGSIAQCVYLEREHRITEHQFWPCVDAVGTNRFNDVCDDDGWLKSL